MKMIGFNGRLHAAYVPTWGLEVGKLVCVLHTCLILQTMNPFPTRSRACGTRDNIGSTVTPGASGGLQWPAFDLGRDPTAVCERHDAAQTAGQRLVTELAARIPTGLPRNYAFVSPTELPEPIRCLQAHALCTPAILPSPLTSSAAHVMLLVSSPLHLLCRRIPDFLLSQLSNLSGASQVKQNELLM